MGVCLSLAPSGVAVGGVEPVGEESWVAEEAR